MYNLQGLFDKLDQFKKEATDSSTNGKKGNKAAALRARSLSSRIKDEFLEFRKQSVRGNV